MKTESRVENRTSGIGDHTMTKSHGMHTVPTRPRLRRKGSHVAPAIAAALLAAAGTFHASNASACNPTTDPKCECSWVEPTWNAPAGAVVFKRDQGQLTPMFDALGEYRTHTMLSTGPNKAVLHNTANPGPASPLSCYIPLQYTTMEQPGFMAVSQSEIFNDMEGSSFQGYQLPMQANFVPAFMQEIAPILAPVTTTIGPCNCTPGSACGTACASVALTTPMPTTGLAGGAPSLTSLGNVDYEVFYDGNQILYDFHSFIAGSMLGAGNLSPLLAPNGTNGTGNGGVCASTVAFMQTRTFLDQDVPYAGGWVQPKTYPHSLLYGGGSLGLNGSDPGVGQVLYNSIFDYVENDSLGGAFTAACATIFADMPGNAANQVLNCTALQECGSSSNDWQTAVAQPGFVADSITDDTLGGWNGGPTWQQDSEGNWFPQQGASVWAGGVNYQLQWSGAGTGVNCTDVTDDAGPTGSTPNGDFTTSPFQDGLATYVAITDVTPTTGPSVGHTTVTIHGQGFVPGATSIFIGGPATDVQCPSSTLCFAYTPPAEYLDFNTTANVEVVVGGVSSASAPLAPTFPFQYVGTGLTGCSGYWTCEGQYNNVNTAVVTCPIPATGCPGGGACNSGNAWELLAGTSASNLAPVSASIGSEGSTEYLDLLNASLSQTTYVACFGDPGQQVCCAPITLQTSQCVCVPETCSRLGACNGTYADGCGGTVTCGACPSGESCSNGSPASGVPAGTCYTPGSSGPRCTPAMAKAGECS